ELTEREHDIVEQLRRHGDDVLAHVTEALQAAQAGTFSAAENALINKARPAYDRLNDAGAALLKTQIEVAQEMRAEADGAFKRVSALIIGAILLGIGVASVLGLLIIRSISSTLSAAVNIANRIANGELGNEVTIASNDELGQLLKSLQGMDGKLVEIVRDRKSTRLNSSHVKSSYAVF